MASAYLQQANAQHIIAGSVTDQNGNPVAGASVYLSQTSTGTTTSSLGDFKLDNLPDGKFNLVISAIGYESKSVSVSSGNYPADLNISLQVRATDLAEVVVQPVDKNGWRIYGRYFTDNFIGTTRNAKFCRIVNRDVIRFRFSEKTNRLIAKADQPIIIENKALGYRISFDLIEFVADYNTDIISFYGYPLFTDISGSKRAVADGRREVYYGSLMHFVRSVYGNSIKEDGFVVRASVIRPNFEKLRVRKLLENTGMKYTISEVSSGVVRVEGISGDSTIISKDSMQYYNKVLKQSDSLSQKVSLASLDEFVTRSTAFSRFIFFKNTMEVQYANKKSVIELKTPAPLEILKNGSYFSPAELITFKYWSTQEKICNMLPLDYSP